MDEGSEGYGINDGLTLGEVAAYLVREPFNVSTPNELAKLTDEQILEIYFAEWDYDDEGGRKLRHRWSANDYATGSRLTGSIERALQELPDPDSIGVPLQYAGPANMDHMIMFWQLWLGRGATQEEILQKWLRHTNQVKDTPVTSN